MTRESILAVLKAERDRLNAALAALEGGRRGPERPPGRRRKMSAEARKKISEAKKKWWARQKSR